MRVPHTIIQLPNYQVENPLSLDVFSLDALKTIADNLSMLNGYHEDRLVPDIMTDAYIAGMYKLAIALAKIEQFIPQNNEIIISGLNSAVLFALLDQYNNYTFVLQPGYQEQLLLRMMRRY